MALDNPAHRHDGKPTPPSENAGGRNPADDAKDLIARDTAGLDTP